MLSVAQATSYRIILIPAINVKLWNYEMKPARLSVSAVSGEVVYVMRSRSECRDQ